MWKKKLSKIVFYFVPQESDSEREDSDSEREVGMCACCHQPLIHAAMFIVGGGLVQNTLKM